MLEWGLCLDSAHLTHSLELVLFTGEEKGKSGRRKTEKEEEVDVTEYHSLCSTWQVNQMQLGIYLVRRNVNTKENNTFTKICTYIHTYTYMQTHTQVCSHVHIPNQVEKDIKLFMYSMTLLLSTNTENTTADTDSSQAAVVAVLVEVRQTSVSYVCT